MKKEAFFYSFRGVEISVEIYFARSSRYVRVFFSGSFITSSSNLSRIMPIAFPDAMPSSEMSFPRSFSSLRERQLLDSASMRISSRILETSSASPMTERMSNTESRCLPYAFMRRRAFSGVGFGRGWVIPLTVAVTAVSDAFDERRERITATADLTGYSSLRRRYAIISLH